MKRLATILLICLFALPCWGVDHWVDVDVEIGEMQVNLMPLTVDGAAIDTTVTYDQAGMVLTWNFTQTDGTFTSTLVTPADGGAGTDYDWNEKTNTTGIYTINVPASGGATINNDTEGSGYFTGNTTAHLIWRGPTYGFRAAVKNNLEIDDGTAQQNQSDMYDGTGYAGGTILQNGNATQISGDATTADNMQIFYSNATTFGLFADYYDTTTVSVAEVFSDAVTLSSLGTKVVADMDANSADFNTIIADTQEIGTAGAGLTNINLPNQTMDIVGSITGSLSGSVGSVTGAVGSVTGAVGSVTGTIGGLTGPAIADFFDTDSGTTYAAAVGGSVVKEIADNAGGSALTLSAIGTKVVADMDANSADFNTIIADTVVIGTAAALDGGAATVGGMLTKMADDNGGADFDAGTDSLEKIRNRGDSAWTSGSADAVTTTVASASSKSTITLTAGKQTSNAYLGMSLTVVDGDGPAGEATETRTIVGWTSGRIALVNKPFSFLPVATDVATIPQGNYFRPVRNP